MAETSLLLTSLSEAQRAQAQERFTIIRPALDKVITQAEVARTHQLSLRTIQRWIKNYREKGLAGLADAKTRSDKGKSRRLPADTITLIEGLALQTPPRSAASIHRQVCSIATEQGWKPPSYGRVRQIIKDIDPALVTLAHEGAAAYREEFDLLYRREATHVNAIWQADHRAPGALRPASSNSRRDYHLAGGNRGRMEPASYSLCLRWQTQTTSRTSATPASWRFGSRACQWLFNCGLTH